MQYSIVGGSLPAVVIQMNPGETIVSEVGGRTWARGPVLTETKGGSVGKAFGRMISGESVFLSHYTAQGPAEIAFSSSYPGRIVARELGPGESVICQKSAFLCATLGVELSVHLQKKIGAGLFGGEGFIMQKLSGRGMAFLEIDGSAVEYTLAPGQQIVVDTGNLAMMDATCRIDIQTVRGAKNLLFGGEGIFNTVVTGPGRVVLQTMALPAFASALIPYLPAKSD